MKFIDKIKTKVPAVTGDFWHWNEQLKWYNHNRINWIAAYSIVSGAKEQGIVYNAKVLMNSRSGEYTFFVIVESPYGEPPFFLETQQLKLFPSVSYLELESAAKEAVKTLVRDNYKKWEKMNSDQK